MHFLLRRLGFYVVAAWVSLTLNFAIPRLMPGNPASAMMARFRGDISPEALDALSAAFGITDAPLWRQYLDYLSNLARGQLGISIAHFPVPVSEVIGTGMVWTLWLTGGAVVISFVGGSLLGVFAAFYRGGRLDTWLPPVLVFLGAFPYFWLAMFALFVFAFTLDWFPLSHAYDDSLTPELSLEFLGSTAAHTILPSLSIVVATTGGWLLNMRNTMMTVLAEDYVSLARAKGLPARQVMLRYAARNALLPNITGFGMALGFVMSGSLLTEVVFAYPGVGYLLIEAVRTQDYPLIQGLFLCITFAVLVANALVDVLYLALDPRARS